MSKQNLHCSKCSFEGLADSWLLSEQGVLCPQCSSANSFKRKDRRKKKSKKRYTPPRYDSIYFEGQHVLDSMTQENPTEFKQQYLGEFEPPSEIDIYLDDLAKQYHQACDEYENTVKGDSPNGELSPAKKALVNRYAMQLKKQLAKRADFQHGICQDAVYAAIVVHAHRNRR